VECNSDPSLPIEYHIYVSVLSEGQDFLTANQTSSGTQITITGLQDGVTYYFVVRAEDAAGNEEDNTIERSAMPTTPTDSSPPSFGGLDLVLADDDNGDVTLSWIAAEDPDDPECNSDPSNPISYNIYVSQTETAFDFVIPTATTGVVRAEDNAGNEEANTVTKSAELAVLEKPFDFLDYWWIFLIIIIILLLVVIALLARRRKGEEPVETPTEVEEGIEEESTEELGDEG
jgi:hypothetical protein